MKYRAVEYAVRARLGRDQWIWTIYPKNAPARNANHRGTRSEAFDEACRAIDRWLRNHRTQRADSLPRNADQVLRRPDGEGRIPLAESAASGGSRIKHAFIASQADNFVPAFECPLLADMRLTLVAPYDPQQTSSPEVG